MAFLAPETTLAATIVATGEGDILGEGIRVLLERTAGVVSADETAQTEVISVTD